MAPKSLNDILNVAGVKVAAAAPAAPAKPQVTKKANAPAAVESTAGDASSQAATEPAGGKKPRDKATEAPAQDTGKTAAQVWLSQNGIDCKDAKVAEYLVGLEQEKQAQVKMAELEKLAEEERCRGAIFYHGMRKEATAFGLVTGEVDVKTAELEARLLGIHPEAIIKRANELAAAVGHPALVGTDMGRAARVDDSRTMQAAAVNGATTQFQPEGAAGTRQPVSGQDEKTRRFVDEYVLPGNPGLSLGQSVDQGKAL